MRDRTISPALVHGSFARGNSAMSASRHLTFEELRRLIPAVALSAAAHLALLQTLPQSVRPHDNVLAAGPALTVILVERAVPSRPAVASKPGIPAPIAVSQPVEPIANSSAPAAVLPFATPGEPIAQPPERLQVPIEESSQPAGVSPSLPQPAPQAPFDRPLAEVQTAETDAVPLLDYYYDAKEVDQPARAVGDGLLEYPREALKRRLPGKVKLRLFIDESGMLVRSEVIDAQPREVFEQAALEAVHTMQFAPARKAEQPVRSQRTVEITFDPDPAALRYPSARR